jgi:GxxExxY protein
MNRGTPGDRRPAIEMALNGLAFQLQVEVPLTYDGVRLPRAYSADIVVGEAVILETKSIATYSAGSRSAAPNLSPSEQLLGGIAVEFQHQPVERWPPPFRQYVLLRVSGRS